MMTTMIILREIAKFSRVQQRGSRLFSSSNISCMTIKGLLKAYMWDAIFGSKTTKISWALILQRHVTY